MADALFVYPRLGINVKHVSIWLPLSFLSASGPLLQHGYSVKILDARLDDKWEETLKEELKKKPIFVGITAMAGPQLHWALKVADIVQNSENKAPIVWGGVLVNLIPNIAIKDSRVDIIVNGDAEETLVELCSRLKNNESLEGLKGVFFKDKDGNPVFNPQRKFVDLDTLPPIPYHLVNINDYFATIVRGEKALIAVTSRGCPWRCAFCYNTAFNVEDNIRKWRCYNAENVVENLKKLKELGANAVYVTEDDFFIDMKRVEKVSELLIKENLNLSLKTSVRANEVLNTGKERLMLMKKAGFTEFQIGAETDSDRLLQLMKKDLKVEQVIAANKLLKEVGIAPKYSWFGGLPTQTIDELKSSIRFMLRLLEENPEARATQLIPFHPYPGTELWNLALQHGLKPPTKFEEWVNFTDRWNNADLPWLEDDMKEFLEKASYFTAFLDAKVYKELFGSKIYKLLTGTYAKIVRTRVKHNFYHFMPEIHVHKYLAKKLTYSE